jgi:hypothetical protein
MSIKGFSTQKKLTTPLVGYTDKESVTTNEFVTAQPSYSDRVALDTVTAGLARLHPAVKTAEANTDSPKRILISTAHGAAKGDVVRFDLASANPLFEASILSTPDADTIILAAELPNDIVTGDEFYLLRYATQRLNDDGSPAVVLTNAPVQYVYDGVDTEVELDTGNPVNSRPLPIWYVDSAGEVKDLNLESTQASVLNAVEAIAANTDTISTIVGTEAAPLPVSVAVVAGSDGTNARTLRVGQEAMADSLSVTLASDQTPIPVTATANSGSFDQDTLVATTASTVTAPANAVGFLIQAPSTNTDTIRWCVGATASTTNGVLMEQGRSEGPIMIGADISICATVSGTNEYIVQWIIA